MTTTSLFDKHILFVPACLLCPCFQANNNSENNKWNDDICSFIQENSLSVIQMPCPEALFSHSSCGLKRGPHGVSYYERLDGFPEHSQQIAKTVAAQIEMFTVHGYKTIVLGVEHSPTCAVNYIYQGRKGTVRRSGIYIQALYDALERKNIKSYFIGINRRYPRKAISVIVDTMQEANR